MMAIGSYFAYIIFVMGTMSVAQDINEERKLFCNDNQLPVNEGNEIRNES